MASTVNWDTARHFFWNKQLKINKLDPTTSLNFMSWWLCLNLMTIYPTVSPINYHLVMKPSQSCIAFLSFFDSWKLNWDSLRRVSEADLTDYLKKFQHIFCFHVVTREQIPATHARKGPFWPKDILETVCKWNHWVRSERAFVLETSSRCSLLCFEHAKKSHLANVSVLLVHQMCAATLSCRMKVWIHAGQIVQRGFWRRSQCSISAGWGSVVAAVCSDSWIWRNAHNPVPGQLLGTGQDRSHEHQHPKVVHEDLPPGLQKFACVLVLIQRRQLWQGKHDDVWGDLPNYKREIFLVEMLCFETVEV